MLIEDDSARRVTLARRLLALPPAALSAAYVAAIIVMFLMKRAFGAELTVLNAFEGALFWVAAAVWSFALATVARDASRTSASAFHNVAIAATLVAFASSLAIAITLPPTPLHALGGGPLMPWIFAVVLSALLSIGLSVRAMEAFEGLDGYPFRGRFQNTVTAILFLPIGIWFLRKRVENLLNHQSGAPR